MVSDFRPEESYRFFLQEIPELLKELESGILGLKNSQASLPEVWELMRLSHSIKGGAACAGLNYIQEISHYLETSFKLIGENEVNITPNLEDLLLKSFDSLKSPILEEIGTGITNPDLYLEEVEHLWKSIQQECLSQVDEPVTVSEGSSLTEQLFREDVPKSMHRMEKVLQGTDDEELISTLKIQTQILKGIGEICHLTEFIKLSESVLAAIEHHPQSIRHFAPIAIKDFWQAHSYVLKGQTIQGLPSQDLLEIKADQIALPASSEATLEVLSPIPDLKLDSGATTAIETQAAASPVNSAKTQQPPNVLLSSNQDWSRIEQLNKLVEDLIVLDNRFLSRNNSYAEILEVFSNCFNRLKGNIMALKRWESHASASNSIPSTSLQDKNSGQLIDQQSLTFIHNYLEGIVEELGQLHENFNDFSLLGQQYEKIRKEQEKNVKAIKEDLLKSQMLPIGDMFHQFKRIVHELSLEEKKQMRLEISGDKTLIESATMERLYNPLVHLVRNAVVHGIETAHVREVFHKDSTGVIRLKAWNQGNHTYIEVSDDGQGIIAEEIRNKAIEKGYISSESMSFLSEQQIYQFLFEPDFSTRDELDQLAGRGMGLYAVRQEIIHLKGMITVTSEVGKGTAFTLRLPMSSTISKLLVFQVGRYKFSLPVTSIAAIVLTENAKVYRHDNKVFFRWGEQFLPMLSLTKIGSYNSPLSTVLKQEWVDDTHRDDAFTSESTKYPLLIVSSGAQCIALQAEEVLFERDLMIKPFTHLPFTPPEHLSGCTILGDGQLVPVLNSQFLLEQWSQEDYSPSSSSLEPYFLRKQTNKTIPVVLVVDDSLTIRNSLAATLSKADYRILQAKDGWDALRIWKQEPQIDAVICDIEMPRMNGLEFLGRCRQQDERLPFIMLTYRSSQKYRHLATQLGATAYLSKPYLDRELLDTLNQCLAD